MKCFSKGVFAFFYIFFLWVSVGPAWSAQTVRIANYNVENLFDAEKRGTEYDEFIPGGASGWNKKMVDVKCANIARVISDLKADVVCLEEVESKKALFLLQETLKTIGSHYPYSAMADTKRQAIGCALLSKYPVTMKTDIPVDSGKERSILKVVFDIEGKPLVIYVNHWASKKSPESDRVKSAKVLKQSINTECLAKGLDFVVAGDFNSNYDEFRSFKDDGTLNDTQGVTGINHILGTIQSGVFTDEKKLLQNGTTLSLYNLWLELPSDKRWSYDYMGRKGSLDNMLIPSSLYDGKGIDYKDNSFRRFDPDYLFFKKSVFRWQIDNAGKGKHLGKGYSDHLPIYADFTINKE